MDFLETLIVGILVWGFLALMVSAPFWAKRYKP